MHYKNEGFYEVFMWKILIFFFSIQNEYVLMGNSKLVKMFYKI